MNCNKFQVDRYYNIIINEEYDSAYAYVYILQQTSSDGSITNQSIIKTEEDQQVVFPTTVDGFYTLITVLVPKDPSNYFYYKNEKFYHNIEEVTIQEIIETNPHLSNITPIYDYYFLTIRLRKCYVEACQEIFNNQHRCKGNIDPDLSYKRDLIWSALNVIQYMAELDQYEEAQRLLEELTSCNGICQTSSERSKCNCRL